MKVQKKILNRQAKTLFFFFTRTIFVSSFISFLLGLGLYFFSLLGLDLFYLFIFLIRTRFTFTTRIRFTITIRIMITFSTMQIFILYK
jgi:hypothetical protein